jgi:hypothetical protein
MGKVIAIALIVIAIWVGLTIYTEGRDQAFGGLFARLLDSSRLDAPATRSTPDRALDAFQRAYDKSEDRVERALQENR